MSSKWRVLLLNTKDSNPNFYIALAVEQALREHPQVDAVFNACYHDALPTASLNAAICWWRWMARGWTAACASGWPQFRHQRPVGQRGSLRSPGQSGQRRAVRSCLYERFGQRLRLSGYAQHLPFAAHPPFHDFPIPELATESRHYLYDVLFIGTAWPNRVQFLRQLTDLLPGVKVKLALPANAHLPRPDVRRSSSSVAWRTANREVARFANRSRIVLTLQRDFAIAGNPAVASTPGPRLFETARLAVSNWLMVPGPRLATTTRKAARSACTRVSTIRHEGTAFLAHPEERLSLARAAQQRTRREHLLCHRVARLLVAVDEHENQATSAVGITANGAVARAAERRVLFVCHNHISLGNFGGVEVYVDQLAHSLPADMSPLIYFPDRSFPESRLLRLLDVRRGTTRDIRFSTPCTTATLTNVEREEHFARLLHDERIDLVHFHHMLGHPWSLPLVARTMGVPTVTTVEDYFASCRI